MSHIYRKECPECHGEGQVEGPMNCTKPASMGCCGGCEGTWSQCDNCNGEKEIEVEDPDEQVKIILEGLIDIANELEGWMPNEMTEDRREYVSEAKKLIETF